MQCITQHRYAILRSKFLTLLQNIVSDFGRNDEIFRIGYADPPLTIDDQPEGRILFPIHFHPS